MTWFIVYGYPHRAVDTMRCGAYRYRLAARIHAWLLRRTWSRTFKDGGAYAWVEELEVTQ